jgi:hypothetical protein
VNVGVVRLSLSLSRMSCCLLPCTGCMLIAGERSLVEFRRARTGTTTGSPSCWSACARRSGASPGAPTCEISLSSFALYYHLYFSPH